MSTLKKINVGKKPRTFYVSKIDQNSILSFSFSIDPYHRQLKKDSRSLILWMLTDCFQIECPKTNIHGSPCKSCPIFRLS